jgi:hypothetical protein
MTYETTHISSFVLHSLEISALDNLLYLMSCIHTQTYINSWLIDVIILTMEFYDSWNPWHSTSITNYQVQNQNWYKSQAQSVMWNKFHLSFYLGKGFTVLWLFVASIEIVSIIKFMKKTGESYIQTKNRWILQLHRNITRMWLCLPRWAWGVKINWIELWRIHKQ